METQTRPKLYVLGISNPILEELIRTRLCEESDNSTSAYNDSSYGDYTEWRD